MKHPTLSVVLATFNEEKNIPDCLESVKNFADEIIIVDGSSTDKTVVSGITGYLREPLIHMADPSFKRYLFRFNRYTDLIAEEYAYKKLSKSPITMLEYMVGRPMVWFFWTTLRHKAILDGWQGV